MQRKCEQCGRVFVPKRSAKFCGDTCRKRAQRSPGLDPATLSKITKNRNHSGGLEAATARELEEAGRLDSMLGQAALVLASRIDSPMETGASIASMTKQLRETMADALKDAAVAADPLDELRRLRDLKRNTG